MDRFATSTHTNCTAPADADKLVNIFQNLWAIRKLDNDDLNEKYLADAEAMLVEQHCIDHESESQSSESSNSFHWFDSD